MSQLCCSEALNLKDPYSAQWQGCIKFEWWLTYCMTCCQARVVVHLKMYGSGIGILFFSRGIRLECPPCYIDCSLHWQQFSTRGYSYTFFESGNLLPFFHRDCSEILQARLSCYAVKSPSLIHTWPLLIWHTFFFLFFFNASYIC